MLCVTILKVIEMKISVEGDRLSSVYQSYLYRLRTVLRITKQLMVKAIFIASI